jgi:hypothetical protein
MPGRDLQQGVLDVTTTNLGLAATYTGPWVPVEGFSKVAVRWFSTGGATITATVEESIDGSNADFSQSAGAAGAAGPAAPVVVQTAARFVRMKLVDSVAATTALRASLAAVG